MDEEPKKRADELDLEACFHEEDCPRRDFKTGVGKAAPPCECIGIDYSLPIGDGEDYFD